MWRSQLTARERLRRRLRASRSAQSWMWSEAWDSGAWCTSATLTKTVSTSRSRLKMLQKKSESARNRWMTTWCSCARPRSTASTSTGTSMRRLAWFAPSCARWSRKRRLRRPTKMLSSVRPDSAVAQSQPWWHRQAALAQLTEEC